MLLLQLVLIALNAVFACAEIAVINIGEAKLTKLAPQCTGDPERYAVAMATAQCHLILGKPLPAIREYTLALSLHPSAEVAMELCCCGVPL